jgi:hypothetical protein
VKFIGKSKIGKLSAKGIEYPQLRLPKNYSQTIGNVAKILEMQYDGRRAFLIVTEQSVSSDNVVLKNDREVLKPCETAAHKLSVTLSKTKQIVLNNPEARKS